MPPSPPFHRRGNARADPSPAPADPTRRPTSLARWIPWLRRGRLAACAREARSCAEELAREAAATEPEFLALGRDLREQHESATALTGSVGEATAHLHASLTGQRIAGPDGAVAATLRAVETGIQDVDTMLRRAETINAGLASLSDELHAFGRAGVLLQSVAVGFAVEASRTPECQAAFGSFVDEIRTLSEHTRDLEQSISTSLAEACAAGDAVLVRIGRELTALRRLLPSLSATTDRAAARTQARIDGVCTELSAMAETTREIGRHTEDAVFHMQFGDLVRQKIEHVAEALHLVARECDRAAGGARDADLAGGARSIEIQLGQLGLIDEELRTAEEHIRTALLRVGDAVMALDRHAPVPEAGAGTTAGPDLRALLDEFGALQQLLTQASAMQQQAIAAGHESFSAAGRIADRMREVQSVNREMHLLSLNAIVKTAALGAAGATLEVLSVQVHELYRQADAVVTTIGREAHRLGEQNSGRLAATGTASGGAQLATALAALERGAGEYAAAASRLGPQARAHGDRLAVATERLASLSSFAERLGLLRRRLDALHAAVAPFAPRNAAARPGSDEVRYTMESERAIHQRVADARPAAAGAPVPPGAATTGTCPAEPSIPPPSAVGAGSLGDNVELF